MVKKLLFVCLAALAVAAPTASAKPLLAGVQDQVAAGPSAGDTFIRFGSDMMVFDSRRVAQTFTAGIDGRLTYVVIPVWRTCCGEFPMGNVFVDVVGVDGSGAPDSTVVLATSDPVPTAALSTFGPGDVTFTFPAPAAVAAGSRYALVLREAGIDRHFFSSLWVSAAAATYGGGHAYVGNSFFGDSPVTYGDRGPGSIIFATYVVPGNSAPGRMAYCSVAGNSNGMTGKALEPGTFLDLVAGQPEVDDHYAGASPALYLEGLGLSCDVPAGYVATGATVGWGGAGDPGSLRFYKKAG